jgi:hypothetical protein
MGGVIHGHVDLLVARARGDPLARVTGDLVADPLEPGQLFDVHIDHVARLVPLVPLTAVPALTAWQKRKR